MFQPAGVPSLKRSELELACEEFSNIIGSLSDYMVYKGTLSSGVEIAVVSTTKNSAKEWSKRCETQFRKKVGNNNATLKLYCPMQFALKTHHKTNKLTLRAGTNVNLSMLTVNVLT